MALVSGVRDVDPSSVGMMEGAFFVGRTELLDWVNSLLKLSLSKVEQCASGCVYIQIVDCVYGAHSKVQMQKVKWSAKHDYEYIQNYKVLQSAFDMHGIKKHIEVDKLIRAKYQDNLEFLQWFKAFFDRQAPAFNEKSFMYNPVERRNLGIGPVQEWAVASDSARNQGSRKCARVCGVSSARSGTCATPQQSTPPRTAVASSAMRNKENTPSHHHAAVNRSSHSGVPGTVFRNIANKKGLSNGGTSEIKIECLQEEIRKLQIMLEKQKESSSSSMADADTDGQGRVNDDLLEQAKLERQFYYKKLRRIEILCMNKKNTGALPVAEVQSILYASDEEEDITDINDDVVH